MSTAPPPPRHLRVAATATSLALGACATSGPGMRSWLAGTSVLSALLLAAGLLAVFRPLHPPAVHERRGVVAAGAVAVALQAAHSAEEYLTGFYDAFPRTLGLPPWGARPFLVFNVAWLLIWVGALFGVRRRVRIAEWPLWFLALALVGNGLAHPLLALARGSYFPGLVTAPLVGIAGLLLLVAMLRASSASRARPAGVGGTR